jgi:RNase P subunit RPR2
MYKVDYCVSCHSPNITKTPAQLSTFVVWRATGKKPRIHKKNSIVTCNNCSFIGSYVRLTEDEEKRLYTGY